jgi:hypothetical protein
MGTLMAKPTKKARKIHFERSSHAGAVSRPISISAFVSSGTKHYPPDEIPPRLKDFVSRKDDKMADFVGRVVNDMSVAIVSGQISPADAAQQIEQTKQMAQ